MSRYYFGLPGEQDDVWTMWNCPCPRCDHDGVLIHEADNSIYCIECEDTILSEEFAPPDPREEPTIYDPNYEPLF